MDSDIALQHPELAAHVADVETVRDLLGPARVVKARGTKYLPQPSGMSADEYHAYKLRAQVSPAPGRALAGLLGLIFRKPVVVRAPRAVADVLDALAGDGSDFRALLLRVVREVLTAGRAGLLIDWTDAGGVLWATYTSEQIVEWHTSVVGGVRVLDRVVVRETVAAGEPFRHATVTRYRELLLDEGALVVRVHARVDDAWVVVAEERPSRRGERLRAVPFVPLNATGDGIDPSEPPLLALVDAAASWYRSSADCEHARFYCATPTPYVCGAPSLSGPLLIGSGTAWIIPAADAKVGLLTLGADGVGALVQALRDKEDLMRTIVGRLLEGPPAVQETAHAVALRVSGETSALASMVANVSTQLSHALRWTAWWLNAASDAPVALTLNSDFVTTRLAAPEIDALTRLWTAGGISFATLHYNLAGGEVMRPGVEVEDERHAIASEDALGAEDVIGDVEAEG